MFITLEGPEGSGKTSHIPHLVEFLREDSVSQKELLLSDVYNLDEPNVQTVTRAPH